MLWAPVPRHRPEAVVAMPGRCSGASRSSLRTPRSSGWQVSSADPFPNIPMEDPILQLPVARGGGLSVCPGLL